jgi:hypothetical protein
VDCLFCRNLLAPAGLFVLGKTPSTRGIAHLGGNSGVARDWQCCMAVPGLAELLAQARTPDTAKTVVRVPIPGRGGNAFGVPIPGRGRTARPGSNARVAETLFRVRFAFPGSEEPLVPGAAAVSRRAS